MQQILTLCICRRLMWFDENLITYISIMATRKKNSVSLEDRPYLKEIQHRIDESAKEISRINEALGLGLVTVEQDGIYREFNNGDTVLIKAGDYRRKKVTKQRIKVR